MADTERVFLVGFRTHQIRALQELGVDVRGMIHVQERGEPLLELEGAVVLPHPEAVRCELPAPTGVVIPQDIRNKVYDAAITMFRRHYFRLAIARNIVLRSWLNMDNLFFLAAALYYDVLRRQKIDRVIFANFPHEGSFIILYHLARIMGLETIAAVQSNFPGKIWIVRDIEDFGTFNEVSGGGTPQPTPAEPEIPFYMARTGTFKKFFFSWLRIIREVLKMILKILTLQFLWNRPGLSRNMNRLDHAVLGLGSPSAKDQVDVDLAKQYVYFPLHLQPEMTTDTWGLRYADQMLAIEELSAALPEGMLIYVKENPAQTGYMREESFFRRMRALPNVRYVSPRVPSFELIRKSRLVATISGTAGWEAAQLGKGVIHFGLAWYARLPGVFRWEGPETLRKALEFEADRDAFVAGFDQVSRKLYPGVLDEAFSTIVENFDRNAEAKRAAHSLVSVMRETRSDPVQDSADLKAPTT